LPTLTVCIACPLLLVAEEVELETAEGVTLRIDDNVGAGVIVAETVVVGTVCKVDISCAVRPARNWTRLYVVTSLNVLYRCV
jgi:hypothetical protein